MKKSKQFTRSLLLSASLTLSVNVSAAEFQDLPSTHWASSFVATAVKGELMEGAGNNKFNPDGQLTYGEYAVVIVNGAYGGKYQSSSSDTHWADPYLNVLLSNNLFRDSNNFNVAPTYLSDWQNMPITREDAATVAARLMDKGNFSPGNLSLLSNFTDVSSLSSGQAQDLADVVQNELMVGIGSTFGVGTSLTRGQAAVVIENMLKSYVLTNKNGTYYSASNTTTTTTTTPDTTTSDSASDDAAQKQVEYVAEVFRLVNVERAAVGLPAYAWNDALMEAAQFKSDEMSELSYFDHTSPIYGGFSGIIRLYLTNYGGAGENIAWGQRTPAAVMTSWMNSEGHKNNILSSGFTQIGIGYADGYWTQQFTGTAGTPVNSTTTTTPDSTTTTTPDSTTTTTPDSTTTTTPDSTTTTTPSTLSGWNQSLSDGTYRFALFPSDITTSGTDFLLNGYVMLENSYTDSYVSETMVGTNKLGVSGHSVRESDKTVISHSAGYNLSFESYVAGSSLVAYQGNTRIELGRLNSGAWEIVSLSESFYPYYLTYPSDSGKKDTLTIPNTAMTSSFFQSVASQLTGDYPLVTLNVTLKNGEVSKVTQADSPFDTTPSTSNNGTSTPSTETTTSFTASDIKVVGTPVITRTGTSTMNLEFEFNVAINSFKTVTAPKGSLSVPSTGQSTWYATSNTFSGVGYSSPQSSFNHKRYLNGCSDTDPVYFLLKYTDDKGVITYAVLPFAEDGKEAMYIPAWTDSTTTTPDSTTTTPDSTTTTPDSTTTTPSTSTQADLIQEVFDLVNQERAAVGLNALIWHDNLMDAAQFKSEEMATLNYFSHTSPVYGGFSGIINLYVSNYWAAAENIASGQKTAAAVMTSWMNSSGHKDNILGKNYTHIGIGYYNGYWTQQFIGL